MCEDFFSDENYQLELNLYNIRKELIAMLEMFEKSLCTVCLNLKCSCNKDGNKIEDKLVNGITFDEDDIADGWAVIAPAVKDKEKEEEKEKEVEKEDDEDNEDEDEKDEEDEEGEDDEEDAEDDEEDEGDLDYIDKNGSIAPPASSLPKPKWDSPKKGESSSSTPEKEPVRPDIEAWIKASRAEAKMFKEPIILQNIHYMDVQKKSHDIDTHESAVDAFFKYFKMSNNSGVTIMSSRLAACSSPARKSYTYF